jgi:DNA-binding MarR family transcriptional regulator
VTRPAAERRNRRLSLACCIYQARLDRALFFRATIFSDIAWDTLLAIYVFGAAGRTLSAGELARAVVESSTTSALRMQRRLVDLALVRRVIDPDDKRRVLIELTEEGASVLENYLDHALERRIVPANADAPFDPATVQWLGRKYAASP